MSVIQFPKFNPAAAKLWAKLSADDKMALLANVWCMQCRDETTITNFNGKAERGSLILNGQCIKCGSPVGRLIEKEWFA